MDKRGANYLASMESIKEKLKAKPLLLQLPIGSEKSFTGVVDLITMKKIVWGTSNTLGNKYAVEDMDESDDLYLDCYEERTKLIEDLADLDDDIATYVLEEQTVPENLLQAAIRRATLNQSVIPVLCGSSYKNKGVQPLLDAIIEYLPGPLDRKYDFVEFYGNELCALAFKIVHDKQRGPLTFVRLYSGEIAAGSSVHNVTRHCSEKGSRLLLVAADDYREIPRITAGNIAAISGLKQVISASFIGTKCYILLSK